MAGVEAVHGAGVYVQASKEMQEFFKALKEHNAKAFNEKWSDPPEDYKAPSVWECDPTPQKTDLVDIDPALKEHAANFFVEHGLVKPEKADLQRDPALRLDKPKALPEPKVVMVERDNKTDIQLAFNDLKKFAEQSNLWPTQTGGMSFSESDSYIKSKHNSFLLEHPHLLKWLSLY